MKIVIACDSFKGCMSAIQAARSMKAGILRASADHEVRLFPMADGGEGTAAILTHYMGGNMTECVSVDAYGRQILAEYGWIEEDKTAVLDAASTIGLSMTPREKRNPMLASSRGVGKMMRDAIRKGARHLVIGLGGTATNDGGMGLLHEFGAVFYDSNREPLLPNAYNMGRIAFIDKRNCRLPKNVQITVACDVKNHLLGLEGATYVFGRQKGLYRSQIVQVDESMRHFKDKIQQTFHVDMDEKEGAGAAGGIGGILLSVFAARMVSGITLVMEESGLQQAIEDADLVLTGEGQTDRQTKFGKVPYGVGKMAKGAGVPCICLSGALGSGWEELADEGITAAFSTADRAMDFKTALRLGDKKLEDLAYNVIRMADGLKK